MTNEKRAIEGVSPEQLRREKEEFEAIVSKDVKTSGGFDEFKVKKAKKATIASVNKKQGREMEKALGPIEPKKAKKTKAKKAKVKAPATGAAIKALELAKARYKDKRSCGDWLATTLADHFLEGETKSKKTFNLDAFLDCCKENGLDVTEKWANTESNGAAGRIRMNGRQKLEIVLARTGNIIIDGKKLKPTGVFLKKMEKAHPEKQEAFDDEEDGE